MTTDLRSIDVIHRKSAIRRDPDGYKVLTKPPRPTGNRCLCRTCGQYFSNDANFRRHRVRGWCISPDLAGLVLDHRGIWRRAARRNASWQARSPEGCHGHV